MKNCFHLGLNSCITWNLNKASVWIFKGLYSVYDNVCIIFIFLLISGALSVTASSLDPSLLQPTSVASCWVALFLATSAISLDAKTSCWYVYIRNASLALLFTLCVVSWFSCFSVASKAYSFRDCNASPIQWLWSYSLVNIGEFFRFTLKLYYTRWTRTPPLL